MHRGNRVTERRRERNNTTLMAVSGQCGLRQKDSNNNHDVKKTSSVLALKIIGKNIIHDCLAYVRDCEFRSTVVKHMQKLEIRAIKPKLVNRFLF